METEDTRLDRPEFLPAERHKDGVTLIGFELIALASLVYGARRDSGPFTFFRPFHFIIRPPNHISVRKPSTKATSGHRINKSSSEPFPASGETRNNLLDPVHDSILPSPSKSFRIQQSPS